MYARERIQEIANRLNLPIWWVESVIVEYFNCRRYAEEEEIWTFDFSKFDKKLEDTILDKKVVIPQYFLMQNIRPADLAQRSLVGLIGLPFITLEDANLMPEGLANKTCFPSPVHNDISVYDPKLDFYFTAIVYDQGIFYQWKIAEFYPIPEKHYGWYKSPLFDTEELFHINRRLQDYRNSPLLKNPTAEFRRAIEEDYDKLEIEREKIRKKILEYHNKKKTDYDPEDAIVPDPPSLSLFESVKLTQTGYMVKTHMEPLFLRSAIRNLQQAKKARKNRNENPKNFEPPLDEIEYSAMCIISATNCLESYINYVISKYLPEESKIFDDTSSHRQKWLWIPTAMNLPKKFKPTEPPFSDFSNLVRWRNNVIHHIPEYTRARGTISHTVNQFNVENAELSVKTVKEMITFLSEGSIIPLPRWIKTDMGSAEYWDEVSGYLSTL